MFIVTICDGFRRTTCEFPDAYRALKWIASKRLTVDFIESEFIHIFDLFAFLEQGFSDTIWHGESYVSVNWAFDD